MILTLDDIKKKHDKAYANDQITREQASDDLVFYWITQWDDQLLGDSQLEYRGEFNILRKAGRQIMADLAANPVQPDFHPKDEARVDGAELIDGMYRAADRDLNSQEAYQFAQNDAVVCGYGAWELYTEYVTSRSGDERQQIHRRYIPEANNTVFWDPSDSSMGKTKAAYVSALSAYSEEGYENLVKELTGEEDYQFSKSSFAEPEQSYSFPWAGGSSERIYVTNFYHRSKVKDKVLTLSDPFGGELLLRESDLDEIMDELLDDGYEILTEKEVERWEVRKYIASGEMVLNGEVNDETGEREGEVIAGELLPVVPCYGEYAPQIEGQSYWCGVTRLAKDPQRLRNFQMSYLADIVSRSPRPKPIFTPEQVQGFEHMYEDSGAENNYPYYLINRKSAGGDDLPLGPVSQMPDQAIPSALIASIDLSRQSVEDVANAGLPQDIADPDLSGKAVRALQGRIDMQSYVYQHNFKHAKKRDAEVWASMATEVHAMPQKVSIQKEGGDIQKVELMRSIIDRDTGDVKVINDLSNLEFDIYADIGPSYQSQKDQTVETLTDMTAGLDPGDPLRNILLMKTLEIMQGVSFDDVRDYARQQLIILGLKDPETEDDVALLEQSREPAPDANMVIAQAEMIKGQAQMAREEREASKDAFKAQNDAAQTEIDMFEAQTDRINTQIDAQKANADIDYKEVQRMGQQIDNAQKVAASFRSRLSR